MKRAERILVKYYVLAGSLAGIAAGLLLRTDGAHTLAGWLVAAVALAVAATFLIEAVDALRQGRFGTQITFIAAIIFAVVLGQYWAAVTLAAALGLTKFLQDCAEIQASRAIDKLLAFELPEKVECIKNKKSKEISLASIRPGDNLRLEVGDIVPIDGIIIEGEASFDESNINGRSEAVFKNIGDEVLAGSINLDGVLAVQATRESSDSLIKHLKRLAGVGRSSRAPLSKLVDIFNLPFLVLVAFLSVGAGLLGHSALRALEVLIVATPAALIIVPPLAFLSGLNQTIRRGVFVGSAAKLEDLAAAKVVAFSKNGILTSASLKLGSIRTFAEFSKSDVLSLAASLEQGSSHAIAGAIVEAATERNLKIIKAKNIQKFPGGLSAQLKQGQVLLGSAKFLAAGGVELVKDSDKAAKTLAMLAVDGRLVGVMEFDAEVRPEAAAMIRQLKAAGLKDLLVLTGDSLGSAKTIAKKLGMQVTAELSPAEKLYAIEKLEPRPAVFVGDGLSDAAAMMAADVGVAFGVRRSPAACEVAGVVIVEPDIEYLAAALTIAKRTTLVAKQNILIGTILTIALMIIFASGRFAPIYGAIAQELVTIVVIGFTLLSLKD